MTPDFGRRQKKSNDWYDIEYDRILIEQSIAKQYGILPAAQGELGWAVWVKLVGGLMDDTPLGRVVAVRSESDASLVRNMPQWQKQLRTEWAAFRAKRDVMRMGAAGVRSEMDALERMMAKMFGGE